MSTPTGTFINGCILNTTASRGNGDPLNPLSWDYIDLGMPLTPSHLSLPLYMRPRDTSFSRGRGFVNFICVKIPTQEVSYVWQKRVDTPIKYRLFFFFLFLKKIYFASMSNVLFIMELPRVTSPPRRFPSYILLTLILYFLFIFHLQTQLQDSSRLTFSWPLSYISSSSFTFPIPPYRISFSFFPAICI